jgi:ribosomal protein S18 acetylase RimI-like enzyme
MAPSLRPVTPADLPAVHALCRAIETADGLPIATPLEEFEEWLDDPHLDLAQDTRLIDHGGSPIAWGRVWHRPSGVREERAFLLGGVAPAHRGRGVGSALFGWQIERATKILRSAGPGLPRHVRAQAYDFQARSLRLYERFGLAAVRWSVEMIRGLEELPEPGDPDGVRIAPWDSSRDEAARLAENEAFLDHWGSVPMDRAAWEHDVAAFGKRLDLSFVALAGDRVVGVCRNAHFPGDEAVSGRRDGWIMRVSTLRSHRGRGVASALIARSLHAFRAAGFSHGALGVDRDNPTGAFLFYERLGFRVMSRIVLHQKAV